MEVLWYAILGKGWGEGVGGFFLLLFLSFVLFYVHIFGYIIYNKQII